MLEPLIQVLALFDRAQVLPWSRSATPCMHLCMQRACMRVMTVWGCISIVHQPFVRARSSTKYKVDYVEHTHIRYRRSEMQKGGKHAYPKVVACGCIASSTRTGLERQISNNFARNIPETLL